MNRTLRELALRQLRTFDEQGIPSHCHDGPSGRRQVRHLCDLSGRFWSTIRDSAAEVRLIERADQYRSETQSPDLAARIDLVGVFLEMLGSVCRHLLDKERLASGFLLDLTRTDDFMPGLLRLRDRVTHVVNLAGQAPQSPAALEHTRRVAAWVNEAQQCWASGNDSWSLRERIHPVVRLSHLLSPEPADRPDDSSVAALEEGVVQGRADCFRLVVDWVSEFSARLDDRHLRGSALLHLCVLSMSGPADREDDVIDALGWMREKVRLMGEAAADAIRSKKRVCELVPVPEEDAVDPRLESVAASTSQPPRRKPGYLAPGESPPAKTFFLDTILEGSKTAIAKVLLAAKVAKSATRKHLDYLAKNRRIMIEGLDGGHSWRVYLCKEYDPEMVAEHARSCPEIKVIERQ